MIHKIRMAELTSEEARQHVTEDAVVLLPMGSLEDQGIHAPMGDYLAADLMALEIAKTARDRGVSTFVALLCPLGARTFLIQAMAEFRSATQRWLRCWTTFSAVWTDMASAR